MTDQAVPFAQDTLQLGLPPNEVHVWCANPSALQIANAEREARKLLAGDEIERLNRFRFAHDQRAYLATRVLIRRVLTRYHGRPPHEWKFAGNAYGQPRIADDGAPRLDFNLSRTAGLVVCAVRRCGEIGIDVENIGPAAMLEVAEHFFAPAEVAALRGLPLERQAKRFYEYWTLKESYIKARGLGLAIRLDRFAFVLEPGRPPCIEIQPELGDDPDAWQFVQLQPTPTHIVSVCVGRRAQRDAAVIVRWQCLI